MLARMLGAARLDSRTFEDVEHDSGATLQALLVVVIVSVAGVVGGLLSGEGDIVKGVIFGVIRGVVSWAVWAGVAMLVGTTILKRPNTHANWGQVARGTGFAQTPGVFGVLVFVPFAGPILSFAIFLWQFAAMLIAIRQTLDYDSLLRAFFVVIISLIPVLIVNAVIFWILRIGEQSPAS